ncbi:MAG: beta-lactamase family protein [SAR202 cluster bacterium]|nr:beta-lactamase family protein [SAR202 cluster bacterium]
MQEPRKALPRTVGVLESGIREGLHLGAQVYVSRDGIPVADFALGEARPGTPLTTEFVLPWMSSVKPVCAVAIARLWEAGKLDLDDRVGDIVPEFSKNGKDRVTLRHLLTHTSGLKNIDLPWQDLDYSETIARVCDAELNPDWQPGRKAGYNNAAAWFILGEVVRRLDGRPYDVYAREEVFEPLGMRSSWLATPQAWLEANRARIGTAFRVSTAGPAPVDLPDSTLTRFSPGGSGRGPIRELGLFYEMLLFRGESDGPRILSPQSVEALTARHRTGMLDQTFQTTLDWGLGFLLDTKAKGNVLLPYQFSRHASRRTFGHGGYQSSIGFADPENRLVVAWAVNGLIGEPKHTRRNNAVNEAVYEDMGLGARRRPAVTIRHDSAIIRAAIRRDYASQSAYRALSFSTWT